MLKPFVLNLDIEQRDHVPGDHIDGTLIVNAEKEARATLTVWLECVAHGRGNSHRHELTEVVVYDGTISEGVHRYPVSLPVPNGPFTYRGQIVNLTWYMKARADVPWALDPKAETEFVLSYEPNGEPMAHIPDTTGLTTTSNDIVKAQTGTATTAVAVVAVTGVIGVGMFLIVGGAGSGLEAFFPILIFGGIGGLIFAVIMWGAMRRAAARIKLGTVDLRASPDDPGPGDTIEVVVSFSPRSTVQLNSVYCDLEAVERVVRGSGTDRTTHTHKLFERRTPFRLDKTLLDAGQEVTLHTTVEIPENAPISFKFPDNTLEWSLRTQVDIEAWPDWVLETTFNVLPSARLQAENDSPVAVTDAPDAGLW